MNTDIRAFAVLEAGKDVEAFSYTPGELGDEDVEIRVEVCGVCHSDLSMLDNEWGRSTYPLVAGHEVVGEVIAAGEHAKRVQVGDRVGLGWFSGSCMSCTQCMGGHHNLCDKGEETIVGRHGGFAERVHAHWSWAIPLPKNLTSAGAAPLFCGGITAFNPFVDFALRPTQRVGVIGIGGLGHLALQFAKAWGCEVIAFSSTEAKSEAAKRLGAHYVVNSRDKDALKKWRGKLDLLISTVNVALDWKTYLSVLAPYGRLHVVGAVLQPMEIPAFSLIGGNKSLAGSPLGSPALIAEMLTFCERHQIEAVTETYPMSKIDDALEHLRSGEVRYRVVLENDWKNDSQP